MGETKEVVGVALIDKEGKTFLNKIHTSDIVYQDKRVTVIGNAWYCSEWFQAIQLCSKEEIAEMKKYLQEA